MSLRDEILKSKPSTTPLGSSLRDEILRTKNGGAFTPTVKPVDTQEDLQYDDPSSDSVPGFEDDETPFNV